MRKNKKELWTNLYIWCFSSALTGIFICFVILILFSAFLYKTTDVIKSFTIFSSISLLAGAFSGGYICGLFRRKNGLYEGFFCGFIMYIMLIVIGILYFRSFADVLSIRKFLICVIPSSFGGVIGVNHKRPKGVRS